MTPHTKEQEQWEKEFDWLGGEHLCVFPPDGQKLPHNHLFRGDAKGEKWPEINMNSILKK